MKRQTLLKSTLCLLMALLCNVAWAQPAVSDAPTNGKWAENTTWFQLKLRNGRVVRADVLTGEGYLALTNTTTTNGDAGLWCIVGNANDGYKFYNRAKGTDVFLGMKGDEGNGLAVFVDANTTGYTTAFDFVESSTANHWCVKDHGSSNKYWNYRSPRLAYWANNSAKGNDGSDFFFTQVDLSTITGLATEEDITAAQAWIKVAPGYPKTTTAQYHMLNVMVNSVGKGIVASELLTAVNNYKTCSDIILPEDGKAYTFTALFKNDNKLYMKYVNGQKVSLSANSNEASVFVCKELSSVNANEKKFAFITADGKILTWVGKNGNQNFYKENGQFFGYSSNYATVYQNKSDWNDITVKKNDTHEEQLGLLRMVGRRSTTENTLFSSFYANKGGGFEQAGDGNLFNNDNTSGWIFTEVTHINTLAQDLALAKIDAKTHVTANADKLGNGIGCAYYVVNAEKKYAAADVNAAIDAASTVDAINAIKNSYAVALPEFGKAYTLTLKANDANKTQYKIIAEGASLTRSTEGESSVFYCLQSDSNEFPYIFVSEDGYVLAYHALTDTYTSAGDRNNFKVGGMTEITSNTTSTVADRCGTVYLTTGMRTASNTRDGCIIFKYSGDGAPKWDNSDAPYHDGTYTSAIIMTEVENYVVPEAQQTKVDAILGKDAVKTQVEVIKNELKNQPGYYYCTIGGEKVYDADAILALIDATQSLKTLNEISTAINNKTLILPEAGKYYRIAYDYGNNGGVKYLQSTYYSGSNLVLTDNKNESSLFYVEQVGENLRLKSYTTGKYIKEEGTTRGLHDVGGNVTFSAGSSIGKIKIQAPSYLHASGGNNACYIDHCGSDGCAQHNFIVEEVVAYTLTVNVPSSKVAATATWNGITKALPATWAFFEGVPTESTVLTIHGGTYTCTGLTENEATTEGNTINTGDLTADRTITASFAPAFLSANYGDKWVRLQNCSKNNYWAKATDTKGATATKDNAYTDDSHLWCLVGDANGFVLYNKAIGSEKALEVANYNEGTAATFVANTGATWKLKEQDFGYALVPASADNTAERGINMWGGDGGDLKLYATGNNNKGSYWKIEAANPLTIDIEVEVGQPYETNTRVAELTKVIAGSSSKTIITNDVDAVTYYLPTTTFFGLTNNLTYRGYTFDGFIDEEDNAVECNNIVLPEGGLALTASYSVDKDNKYQYLFYYRDDVHNKPYRIPAIATASNNTVLAFSDYRPCSNDIGYGEVDIMLRRSYDNGETWSAPVCIADGQGGNQNVFNVGFGDAAVVADRESGKVLVMAVAGKQVFAYGSATGHNSMAKIVSNDNGESWDAPEDVTSQFMIAENSLFPKAYTMFFGSGRMLQSRVYKAEGAAYYRIYGALLIKHPSDTYTGNCNYVVYSDDFGSTWKILGGSIEAGMCCNGGDEPKVEELPDGSIVLSSRKYNGRYFNVFTYTDKATGAGAWGEAVASNNQTDGISFGGNATNGEIYKVKAIHNESGRICDVMLQSIPTGGGRSNVSVYFKEMSYAEAYTPTTFAQKWTKGLEVSAMGSAYSTMILQADGNFGFFYEEEPGDQWAYCMVYVPLSLEEMTKGAYSLYTVNSTISQYGVGTFYASEAMQIPEGIKAYVATEEPVMENGAGVITMTELEGIIPAHTGAVLRGDAATYKFIPSISYGAAVKDNMLVGFEAADNKADSKKAVTVAEDYTTYVLTVQNEKAGFYRKDADFKVYNNKAYLQVPDAVSANALRIRIEGEQDDYTTEIVMPVANGQQPTAIYDLTGRRVQKVQKGLYIVNGKKVWK